MALFFTRLGIQARVTSARSETSTLRITLDMSTILSRCGMVRSLRTRLSILGPLRLSISEATLSSFQMVRELLLKEGTSGSCADLSIQNTCRMLRKTNKRSLLIDSPLTLEISKILVPILAMLSITSTDTKAL